MACNFPHSIAYTGSDDVLRGMPSIPLDNTHGRTTSTVACHHRPWNVYMIKRYRVSLVIIALGKHTRSDHVGRGMPARPLGDTYSRMTLGVACHYCPCDTHTNDAGCDMPSLTLSNTHGRMTLGVACHQRPRVEQTV